ncbi:hypothetical protein FH5_01050 [Priestia endophytica]|nr:hypothetical protein FH5_01050 [Priestia endophytica]
MKNILHRVFFMDIKAFYSIIFNKIQYNMCFFGKNSGITNGG